MGPFHVSFGFNYILLAVDYVSKWMKAKATRTNDAQVVVDFVRSNIFCRFGVPRAIVSDQGTHFCNRLYSRSMRLCIESLYYTTPKQMGRPKFQTGISRESWRR